MGLGVRPWWRLDPIAVLAVALLLGSGLAGQCAAPATAESPGQPTAAAAPTTPAVIPIDEIAPRATEVARQLSADAEHLPAGAAIAPILQALPDVSTELKRELERTRDLLSEQPSLETLQILTQLWQQRQTQLNEWLEPLSKRAARLQESLDRLSGHQETWTRTRDVQRAAQAPDAVLEQIDATLAAIAAAQPLNRAWRDAVLELQAKVAQEMVRCETARAEIAQLQQGAVGGILARNGQAIWDRSWWTAAREAVPSRWSEIVATYSADLWTYVRDPSMHMPIHVGIFVVALVALSAGRRRVELWAATGENVSRVTAVFNHPLAAALLLALMAATLVAAPTPYTVKQLLDALAMVPIIVLARPVVHRALVPLLYVVGILFALDTVRHAFGGIPPLVDQGVILLESLTGITLLAWLLVHGGWGRRPGTTALLGHPLVARFLIVLALCVLVIGLLASVLGYLRLARLMTPAVLVGAADALWLYAVVEVASAVVAYALRVWPLRYTYLVQHHRRLLETRLHRVLVWLAIVGWWTRYLNYLGLWEPALAAGQAALDTQIALGSFNTSVGDILAFVVTLGVAYLVSSLIRFVLAEEVYPRAGIATGTSYAASSVFHYAIMTLAFLLALGLLGVTMTQVTVLAGALGVGIGFGLQGVVNNFVSGLILLFERPINVGDAVQVGELQGWVRRIGIRASVVRTFQGAEIIVPNAQLTTQQVTNWTLSDQQRRIELSVGLSYGVAPAKVIELLEGVASAHPRVLRDPAPRCLFMGYGDSSINFELRAWTDYAAWIQVQSDLTAAVYDAVYAAGMSFPFPQREVRLLSDPVASPAAPGSDPGKRLG